MFEIRTGLVWSVEWRDHKQLQWRLEGDQTNAEQWLLSISMHGSASECVVFDRFSFCFAQINSALFAYDPKLIAPNAI